MPAKTSLIVKMAISVFFVVFLINATAHAIIYVDDDAVGDNNGSCWDHAYKFLQDALAAAANGDEIRVAQGIYKPDQGAGQTPGDRTAKFQIKKGITIKGGFAGLGWKGPNVRNVELYKTILSGDLNGDDDIVGMNDNSSCVVYVQASADFPMVLDGLTVTAGFVTASYIGGSTGGSGLTIIGKPDITIVNCTFTGNYAIGYGESSVDGAAIVAYYASPVISNCTFRDNYIESKKRIATGAGIWCYEGSPVITDCQFIQNTAVGNYPSGAGIWTYEGNTTVSNCTFRQNRSEGNFAQGAGLMCLVGDIVVTDCEFIENKAVSYNSEGGGMWNNFGHAVVTGCKFIKNSADRGGGLLNVRRNSIVTNCIFTDNSADEGGGIWNYAGNPTVRNCLFAANSSEKGGALWNYEGAPNIVNCTITSNTATEKGGGIWNWEGNPNIVNTIMWLNSDQDGTGEQSQIYNYSGSPLISHSWIAQDPLFLDPANRDYHFNQNSPCFNAGDPDYIAEPDETDLDGKPRILNGRIDMGAYEVRFPRIYVDDDATGANNGTSWADAYNFLQDGLAAAWSGDQIFVAQGTYKPDQGAGITPGDRTATFQLINGVILEGGYAGAGSPDPNARDIQLYETILSGDLNGDDGPYFANNTENSYCIVTGTGTDHTTVLDGLTVTAANANPGHGGGMYNRGCSATIMNCAFIANSAGGMYNDLSSPKISNCTFNGNSGGLGGGMRNDGGNPILTDCTFTDNWAGLGGGMYNYLSDTTLTNCTFTANFVNHDGGGIVNEASSPKLTNCMFTDNSATRGGGIYNYFSFPELTDCTFNENIAGGSGGGMYSHYDSSPTLNNCAFSRNEAWDGGAMYNDGKEGSCDPVMNNCTFSDNSVVSSGGGMCNSHSSPILTDCTLSDNSADWGGGIYNVSSSPTLAGCTFSKNSAGNRGGGIQNEYSNTTVTGCTFTGNSARNGGGMSQDSGDVKVTRCTFSNNIADYGGGMINLSTLTLSNCTFTGNSAIDGGGLFNDYGTPAINNCTFSGNSAQLGGGIYCYYSERSTMTNCILWGNTADSGPQIALENSYNQSFSYCDIEGGWPGEGNIDEDPLFVNVTIDDYHLLPGSPCINTGDPDYIAEPNETDLDGNPRIIGLRIDMGAYESPLQAEARIVPNTINLASKGNWITCYIQLPEEYNVADIDPDTVFLEDEIKAESVLTDEQQQVATVRFSREQVRAILDIGETKLTITGRLTDGAKFEAADTIKIIGKNSPKPPQ